MRLGVSFPRSCKKNKWIRQLGSWFSGQHGGAELMVGLDDLGGLCNLKN